jgi:hypothetical protein
MTLLPNLHKTLSLSHVSYSGTSRCVNLVSCSIRSAITVPRQFARLERNQIKQGLNLIPTTT